MRYKAIKDYQGAPDNPIKLKKGEQVKIMTGSGPIGEWPNWLYCKAINQEGWIPAQIIEQENNNGIIMEDYNAREFNFKKDDIFLSERELNGWIWGVKANEPDQFGWAPLNCLKQL